MKTTYHRDGSVTIWDCHTQSFTSLLREDLAASPLILAALNDIERAKVVAHVCGLSIRWTDVAELPYLPVTDDDGPAAGNVVLIQCRRRGAEIITRRVAANGRHFVQGKPASASFDDVLGGNY